MDQDLLKKHLTYEKGHLWWLKPTNKRIKVGQKYGCLHNQGYVSGRFKGRAYLEHRLIWFYHYGEWPMYIDHIDGNRLNNEIENLRVVSFIQNATNRLPNKQSTSVYKGVGGCKYSNRWRARCQYGGIKKTIGYFNSEIEAAEAYDKFAKTVHGKYGSYNFG